MSLPVTGSHLLSMTSEGQKLEGAPMVTRKNKICNSLWSLNIGQITAAMGSCHFWFIDGAV